MVPNWRGGSGKCTAPRSKHHTTQTSSVGSAGDGQAGCLKETIESSSLTNRYTGCPFSFHMKHANNSPFTLQFTKSVSHCPATCSGPKLHLAYPFCFPFPPNRGYPQKDIFKPPARGGGDSHNTTRHALNVCATWIPAKFQWMFHD